MSYLIVSSIQMGANIDYAIVISGRFMELKDTRISPTLLSSLSGIDTANEVFSIIFSPSSKICGSTNIENKSSKTDTGQNTEQTENVGPSEKNEDGIQETEEKREMETIEIRTAEDFLQFADQCHIDSWSENKHVVLKEDIDLSSVRTPMIPVFAGVFFIALFLLLRQT